LTTAVVKKAIKAATSTGSSTRKEKIGGTKQVLQAWNADDGDKDRWNETARRGQQHDNNEAEKGG